MASNAVLLAELRSAFGLHLSPAGLVTCQLQCAADAPTVSSNAQSVFDAAIDTHLKEIADAVLPADAANRGTLRFPGLLVLQVAAARNLSAPAIRQSDAHHPRMLGLTLTDGHFKCQAVEYAPIAALSLALLLPGTKLVLRDFELVDGVALLTPAHVVRACGRVEAIARAQQMKDEAATLRQRMFRSSLGDDEEPPPAFTMLEAHEPHGDGDEKSDNGGGGRRARGGKSAHVARGGAASIGDSRQQRPVSAAACAPARSAQAAVAASAMPASAVPPAAAASPLPPGGSRTQLLQALLGGASTSSSVNSVVSKLGNLNVAGDAASSSAPHSMLAPVTSLEDAAAATEASRRQFSGAQIVHRGRATAFSAAAFQRKKGGGHDGDGDGDGDGRDVDAGDERYTSAAAQRHQRRGGRRRGDDNDDGADARATAAAAAQETALAHLPPIEKLMQAAPGYRLRLSVVVNEINVAVVERESTLMFSLSDLEMQNMLVVRGTFMQASASKELFLELIGVGSNIGFSASTNAKFMQAQVHDLSARFSGFETDVEATVVGERGNVVLLAFDTGAPIAPAPAVALGGDGDSDAHWARYVGDASDPFSLASSRGRGRGGGRGGGRGRGRRF